MPRTAIPVTAINKAGVAPPAETNGDVANNHSVSNDGRTVLLIRNNGATPRTASFRLAGAVDGQAITAKTVTVPATSSRYVGPFDTTRYGTTMQVDVDHADLRLSALRIA
ncbi:MAG: hypothetical protein ABW022_08570 [Actinoplanes sp.]